MRRLTADLWETQPDLPYPGVHTHGYLWTGGPEGNILFYSTVTDADFDRLAELGGVDHQYLSHRDEAGPVLAAITERFGARLHAPAAELFEIGQHAHVDVPLGGGRHVDANTVEVIPTPGHSPGSTCFLVHGTAGRRYLFTGDTIIHTPTGWAAGFLPGISDASALAASLRVLATLTPDLVISSAYAGDDGVHAVPAGWPDCVEQALTGLSANV